MDDLDAILDAIDDGETDDLFDAPVFLPGELQGTDEEIMAFQVEGLHESEANGSEGGDEDEYEGDPLLIGADGKQLSDDQLKLLYTISRYSHKVCVCAVLRKTL